MASDTAPLVLNIYTRARGEPAGYDSLIVKVPARWYVQFDGQQVFLVPQAGRELRALSEEHARGLGEKLHHAEWAITSDPAQVETLGLIHDCPTCRAGVDQALAFLRDNPDEELAVGQLWWAQQ